MINRSVTWEILLFAAALSLLGATADAGAQIAGAPVLNNNQPLLTSGPSVTLSWTAPTVGAAIEYIIEASSEPGGPANLANFSTGNASTSLVVPSVPPGVYYVRIRAADATGVGAPSNEVQLVVSGAGGGSCPSAPVGFTIVAQNGSNVTFGWQPPSSGAAMSYVIQAGSAPNAANLANFDTGNTTLTLTVANVPAGTYFVRVYARSSGCAAPSSLTAASNEVTLIVGSPAPAGWSGPIVCRVDVTGPNGYHHAETQTWLVGGPGQTVGPRTNYPVQWSAQGSGGAVGKSWTINSMAATILSVTTVASTGIPLFDRTTTGIIVDDGIVGTPISFDLYEIEFPGFTASSPNATSVIGTYSRPTVGGDSPQQPGNSTGTLACTWSLTHR